MKRRALITYSFIAGNKEMGFHFIDIVSNDLQIDSESEPKHS